MVLYGATGDSFELRIVGYEFTSTSEDIYDANWLMVNIRVGVDDRNLETTEPLLLTWEVISLADWLDSIAARRPSKTAMEFLEPDLRFELQESLDDPVRLRACAQLAEQSLGPAMPRNRKQDVCVELECSTIELKKTVADLRLQLSRFPPRGDIGLSLASNKS